MDSSTQFNGVSPVDLTEEQLQTLLNIKKKQAARSEMAKTTYAAGPITRAPSIEEMLETPASRRTPEFNASVNKQGITKKGQLLDTLSAQGNLTDAEKRRLRSLINSLRATQGKNPLKY